ncbi:dipeptidase [Thalassorhabdus alkalitolerans]|uniref:Dipeptidase n=1 Tax=Thalassorhabdus alkalitolerans TaxID=2282697 RepID=A0ABW0YL20_9BACI
MFISDTHSDPLWKMWKTKDRNFSKSPALSVSAEHLVQGGVNAQVFALFVPVAPAEHSRFSILLAQMDLFYEEVITHPCIRWEPGQPLHEIKGKTQAILALEGAGYIGEDPVLWRLLKHWGVEMASLTWNEANELGDGVLEERGAGLSSKGKHVVKLHQELGIVTDISHLNEHGFWDVVEHGGTLIASHSNSSFVCGHKRNLTDQQIRALIQKNSFIGLTFYPPFITEKKIALVEDLASHIDHIGSLGGIEHVGFGSDFDGIDQTIQGLSSPADYDALINWLLKRYDENIVRGIAGENFARFWRDTRRFF